MSTALGTRQEAIGHLRTLAASGAAGDYDQAGRWLDAVARFTASTVPWAQRRDAGRHCLIIGDADLTQHMLTVALGSPDRIAAWADALARGDHSTTHGHLAYLRTVMTRLLDKSGPDTLTKPLYAADRAPQSATSSFDAESGPAAAATGPDPVAGRPLSDSERVFARIESDLRTVGHHADAFSAWLATVLTTQTWSRTPRAGRIDTRTPDARTRAALDRLCTHHTVNLTSEERERFAVLAGIDRHPLQTVLRWLLLIKLDADATHGAGNPATRTAVLGELSRRPEDWPHLWTALRERGYTRAHLREVLTWADRGSNAARTAPVHLRPVIRAFTADPSAFTQPGCRITRWHPDHPRSRGPHRTGEEAPAGPPDPDYSTSPLDQRHIA